MSEAYQAHLNQQNPQYWNPNAQAWPQGLGLGQAAFGQQNLGGQGGWPQNQGWGNPWQQRLLSQQDVGEIVRQLLPVLPQVVAQAQQGQAAFGYGGQGYGGQNFGGFGQNQGFGHRHLSPQDVNEVVRQILPVIPQIVNLLQGQQGPYGNAIYGNQGLGYAGNAGWNTHNAIGLQGWSGQGGNGNPFAGNQGFGGQAFGPLGQAAFGNAAGGIGGYGPQRQLSAHEVGEIVRQLTAALPQVIANLQQTLNQQQRSAA